MKKGIILSIIGMVVMITVPLSMLLGLHNYDDNKSFESNLVVEEELSDDTVIVVDIGHGGTDNGTINSRYTGSILEKDVNLEIGRKLIDKLNGIDDLKVIATRTDDTFISLSERATIGNENNADIFISIHCNASTDGNSDAEGIETFYYNDSNNSKELATKVQENLIRALNKNDRGVKKGNYQVLRDSENTAILVECGFLTNSLEREQLCDNTYQDILVSAIVRGITEFMNDEGDSEV